MSTTEFQKFYREALRRRFLFETKEGDHTYLMMRVRYRRGFCGLRLVAYDRLTGEVLEMPRLEGLQWVGNFKVATAFNGPVWKLATDIEAFTGRTSVVHPDSWKFGHVPDVGY